MLLDCFDLSLFIDGELYLLVELLLVEDVLEVVLHQLLDVLDLIRIFKVVEVSVVPLNVLGHHLRLSSETAFELVVLQQVLTVVIISSFLLGLINFALKGYLVVNAHDIDFLIR